MSPRPLAVAVVAGVAAAGGMALRHRLPAVTRARWDRTNHAGATVTLRDGSTRHVSVEELSGRTSAELSRPDTGGSA